MSTDKAEDRKDAAVPAPVVVEPPAVPAPSSSSEIATDSTLFKNFDAKNLVPTILAVYAHFQTLKGVTDEERTKLLTGVLVHLVDTAPGLPDDKKGDAKALMQTLVPHVIQAIETVKKEVESLIPPQLKAVEAKVKSCFGW